MWHVLHPRIKPDIITLWTWYDKIEWFYTSHSFITMHKSGIMFNIFLNLNPSQLTARQNWKLSVTFGLISGCSWCVWTAMGFTANSYWRETINNPAGYPSGSETILNGYTSNSIGNANLKLAYTPLGKGEQRLWPIKERNFNVCIAYMGFTRGKINIICNDL